MGDYFPSVFPTFSIMNMLYFTVENGLEKENQVKTKINLCTEIKTTCLLNGKHAYFSFVS